VRVRARFEQPRLVAIENALGYGLALARRLLHAGEELVDVPAVLTCDGRRSSGRRGKHDQGDALVVARIALRDQERLPRIDTSLFDDELKLLADAREQLIVEAGRWRNRAHALLRVAAPGYQARTGALASAGAVRRAQAVARRAQRSDPVRGRLALEALARLTALERDAGKLEREISQLLKARGYTNLLAIRGVGPIVAAKILGETRGISRFHLHPWSPVAAVVVRVVVTAAPVSASLSPHAATVAANAASRRSRPTRPRVLVPRGADVLPSIMQARLGGPRPRGGVRRSALVSR
jgi:transposase